MYFQSIEIDNYGSIINFNYQFRFDENGYPVPLVLIGENGTGKTLTIANLVDALIEIKRINYKGVLFEVNDNNYYKIGTKNYISVGKNTSRVSVALKHGDEKMHYIDIMSHSPEKIADDTFVKQGDIKNHSDFEEKGFYKEATSSLKKKNYTEFISLYFPVDRFYLPMWYNNENYNRIDYSKKSNINDPDTNLIKTDILSNIKEWLKNIYLQTTFQIFQMGDNEGIPEELRGKRVSVNVDTDIQRIVKEVMNTILDTNDYQPGIMNRRMQTVSFTMSGINCKDISQLSEGQMSLFAIALSIIKEWDISHEQFELGDISGCVIIDEADLGLHINYMHDCFPRMMKLFPKVQFILTTHSPFMIAGLSEVYGDDIDILAMPEGLKITDINAFSEVQKAQEIVDAEIGQIRAVDNQLKSEIEQLRKMHNRVMLYTEGTTDELLIKKALEKLDISDISLEVRAASQKKGKQHNDDTIIKLLTTLQENPCTNNTVIGLFDRDADPAIVFINEAGNEVKLVDYEYIKLGDHIFALALPVPHNRPEVDQISIEHYFTDKEIITENENHCRLFLGNEFYPSGNHIDETKDYHYRNAYKCAGTIRVIEHEQKAYVTDRKGNGDFSLSKQRFAEAVCNENAGFDHFDFSEFNKIFDVIRKIVGIDQVK